MNTCKTCKHWTVAELNNAPWVNHIVRGRNPNSDSWVYIKTEEESAKVFGHRVRFCGHPLIYFYERPLHNGAAVVDGSEYRAALITGEDFGCVLHETSNV